MTIKTQRPDLDFSDDNAAQTEGLAEALSTVAAALCEHLEYLNPQA